MNFLAHFYLSPSDDEIMLGNFIGEAVKGRLIGKWPSKIETGIALHRLIDSESDKYALEQRVTEKLHPHVGKYAPVALDLLNDFLLARFWEQYHAESLKEFANRCYTLLLSNREILPTQLHPLCDAMIRGRWLEGYATRSGIEGAMLGLSRRTRYPSHLIRSLQAYDRDPEFFQNHLRHLIEHLKETTARFLT